MISCSAQAGVPVRLRAVFGENGTGWLTLFQKQNGVWVKLARSPNPGASLNFVVPAVDGETELSIGARNIDFASQDKPVYIKLDQDGIILPLEKDGGIVNGSGPFRKYRLTPDAPHGGSIFYRIDVRFS